MAPLTLLHNPIWDLSILLLVGLVPAGVAGLYVVLSMKRRMTARLLILEEAAARVAERALGTEPLDDIHLPRQVTGNDEIGSLARSFRQVVAALNERTAANAALRVESQSRVRELTALLDISRTTASTLELAPLLRLILDHLRDVLTADGAALLSLQGDELVVLGRLVPGAPSDAYPTRYSVEAHGAIWSRLLRGEAVIIDDVRGESPLAADYRTVVGEYTDTVLSHERAFMLVPMYLKGRLVGMVSATSARAGYFTEHHATIAGAVAQQAAVAIENARLYEEAREVAVQGERQRLARELHDSVSQALYSVALWTKTARTLLDRDPRLAVEPLEHALEQAEVGLTEMRALIFELRPKALEREGLVAALRLQAEAVQARHGIVAQVQLDAEPRVPFDVKEAVYHIAQEALSNTVKHAQARCVDVRLAHDAAGLTLNVHDDGRGFEVNPSSAEYEGLRAMQERALRVGGVVTVTSSPGQGTRVCVAVPGC